MRLLTIRWGFGASAGKSFTKHVSVNGGVKFYTGTVTLYDTGFFLTDVNADVTGYQLTLGLTATL